MWPYEHRACAQFTNRAEHEQCAIGPGTGTLEPTQGQTTIANTRIFKPRINSAPKKVHLCLWCLNSNRHYTFSTSKITTNWEIKTQAQGQQKSQIY